MCIKTVINVRLKILITQFTRLKKLVDSCSAYMSERGESITLSTPNVVADIDIAIDRYKNGQKFFCKISSREDHSLS